MFEVKVKLHYILKKYSQDKKGFETLCFSEGALIKELLKELNIPNGEVGPILMDGMLVNEDTPLKDGVVMEIYPIFGGG